MKKILILTMLLMSGVCFGQKEEIILPMDSARGSVAYTQVIKIDSVNAAQLYAKAKIWIADEFRSAKDVIQFDDKELHTVIVKGVDQFYIKGLVGNNEPAGWINFSMKIECKDEKYKYTISDFVIESTWGTKRIEDYKGTKGQKQNAYKQVNDIAVSLAAGLEKAMNKTVLSNASDW